jgi:hypothetical protein
MRPRAALCVIVGFLGEADVSCALLGYYAASSGNYVPTFRDNETSVSNYQYSLRNNPEERSSKRQKNVPTFMFSY